MTSFQFGLCTKPEQPTANDLVTLCNARLGLFLLADGSASPGPGGLVAQKVTDKIEETLSQCRSQNGWLRPGGAAAPQVATATPIAARMLRYALLVADGQHRDIGAASPNIAVLASIWPPS